MSRITDLADSVYESFALLAGMQLDLFTPLADGPLTATELADRLNSNPEKLATLCYALAAADLLVVEENRFSNTDEANRYLVRGRPDFMCDRHQLWSQLWQATLGTAQTVRTGHPRVVHDFAALSTEDQTAYFEGLHPAGVKSGRAFASAHDLKDCATLLDVGCGSGGFAIGLAETCPNLHITGVDLENVIPIARRYLAGTNLEDRIEVTSLNLLSTPMPGSYDVAVLKNFLQIFSRSDAQIALSNVTPALQSGARIYVTGDILDNTRAFPRDTATFNLAFINIYENGQAYTQHEYETWLEDAGYNEIRFLTEDLVTAMKI